MYIYTGKEEEKSFTFFQIQCSEVLTPISFCLYTLYKKESKTNTKAGISAYMTEKYLYNMFTY